MTLKNNEYKSDLDGLWISREALESWVGNYDFRSREFKEIDKSMSIYFSAKEELLSELLNL